MRLPKGSYLFLLILVSLFTAISFTSQVKALEDVTILSHTGYLDSSGYYHVVGELENIGEQAVNFVQIEATFYQADDVVITVRIAVTMLNTILVNRKSPFEILLLDTTESSKVDHYNLNLTFLTTASIPEGLEILSYSSYVDDSDHMHINGEIKNVATEKAQTVKVIATYYDDNGKVVAAAMTLLDPIHSELDPNQTMPFEILLTDETRTPLIKTYELTAGSLQYAIIPEFPKNLPFLTVFSVPIILTILYKYQRKKL